MPSGPQRITGEGWINHFAKELGQENKYSVMPNWLAKGFGLFVPFMKELDEMNYQCDRDYFFDSSKFNNYLNFTPITHAVAVRQAVAKINDIKD